MSGRASRAGRRTSASTILNVGADSSFSASSTRVSIGERLTRAARNFEIRSCRQSPAPLGQSCGLGSPSFAHLGSLAT